VYLEFVENYCMDSDYPLNLSVSGHLNGLAMFLYREKSYERIRKIILAFNTRLFKKLGWKRKEGEREVLTMLRSSVIASLGIHGDKGVRRIAERMLSDKMSKNKEIDPNIRSAIYRINAWHGDASLLRKFRAMYLKERMPEEKLRLLGIMGAFSKPSLLERSLAFSLSKDVRYQDSIYIPGSMAGNPIGKDLLWDWTRENWKLLVKRNPSGGHMLKGYVGNLETISSAESLERIMHFFSDKRNRRSDIDLAIEQAFEMIEINVRFVKRNSDVEWPT
jgi:hypothetical protein